MLLGALVDAGVPFDDLRQALGRMPVEGYSLSCRRDSRGGVAGTRVSVGLDGKGRRPRTWQELVGIVEATDMSPRAAGRAASVIKRLAEAEAEVHGVPVEEVRLHELGTLDTLVDVVGAVVGLELLGADRVYSSPLPTGSGQVRSEHGVLPVPAPATVALLAMATAPIVPPPAGAGEAGEMVTPTGASILTTLATFAQPAMRIEAAGYGLGSRDPGRYPNVLAVWVGEEETSAKIAALSLIETNVDDMSAEMLGYAQERLFEMGARDVWFSPIQMKKNRPATMLSALVAPDLESRAVDIVLRETSTLGVRVRPVARYEAQRETVELESSLGPVSVKIKILDGRRVGVVPEYEDCRRVALETGRPLQEVYRRVLREAEDMLPDG